MIEQYIYSRAEKVGVGFGFMALSPHMTQALKDEVQMYCESCPEIMTADSTGKRLPLYRKVYLPVNKKVLMQGSAWIEENVTRPFHVSHGYLIDEDAFAAIPVQDWTALAYRLEDLNLTESGIHLDSLEAPGKGAGFWPLSETMRALRLNEEEACRLLLACFDALASGCQVRIAFDFSVPDAKVIQDQVVSWLLALLPYELRIKLGTDSIYTASSSSRQIQIAFVDKDALQGDDVVVGDRLDRLEDNFLVRDGYVIHSDRYPCVWFEKKSLFASWLGRVVEMFWKSELKPLWDVAHQELDGVYARFQAQLDSAPLEIKLDSRLYDAVCWTLINGSEESGALAVIAKQIRGSVTGDEARAYNLTVMTMLGDDEQSIAAREKFVNDLIEGYRPPADKKKLEYLSMMLDSGMEECATILLSVFMAGDIDQGGAGVTKAMRPYEELPAEVWAQLLSSAFFGPDDELRKVWGRCGVKSDAAAAELRRKAWQMEMLAGCKSPSEILGCMERALSSLKGLEPQERSQLANEMEHTILDSRLKQLLPSPTSTDVVRMLKDIGPYRGGVIWDTCCNMVADLANRCKLGPGEGSLAEINELKRVFAPYAEEKPLADCWKKLSALQVRALSNDRTALQVNADTTDQIRGLAGSLPPEAAGELKKLLLRVYDQLLSKPQPFMSASWFQKEVDSGLLPDGDIVWDLHLLADLTRAKDQNWALLKQLRSRYGGSDNSLKNVLYSTVPEMFLTGQLHSVSVIPLYWFMSIDPKRAGRYLLQAARQSGGALLEALVRRAYDLCISRDKTDNLILALRTIREDPNILDEAMRADKGSPEVDEKLVKLIVKLITDPKSKGVFPYSEAYDTARRILAHYKRRVGDGRQTRQLEAQLDKAKERL